MKREAGGDEEMWTQGCSDPARRELVRIDDARDQSSLSEDCCRSEACWW